ncbi:restriction endonuclease subunit S [Heliobacterium chlorum]|uniref:Restriction endonuclease subunit S n=1 Tax=Heliobacterium chlorum TaxID=2698 RepID=A0ABR7T8Q1_HELCL|nr:restriction endonuclease subunit S [Heliobacterium chlorum]MBC9786532.1 restriction endonuclease subunit S [Heliobacterium chlorum]
MAKKKKLSSDDLINQAIMKDDEVPFGLPNNWVWTRIKSITLPMTTTKPDKEYFKYIDIDAIDNRNQIIKDFKTIETASAPSRATRGLEEGNTLFSMVRPYLRNIAYVHKEYSDCIASTGFYVCKPSRAINSRYLYFLLCSEYVIANLTLLMKGDNSPSIRGTELEEFPIPLAPLPEQKRIVDLIVSLFEKLDRAKELVQIVLDSYENRKSAILHKAFSGELTEKWREENGLGLESWKNILFRDLVYESKLGLVRNINEQSIDFEIKYLKMNNIHKDGYLDLNNLMYVNAPKSEIEAYKLKSGDFLFNTRNSRELVGKNAVYKNTTEEPVLYNNNIMRVRFTKEVISDFVCYYLNSAKGKAELDKIKKVTTNVAAIYAKDLNKIIIPTPSIKEQQEICAILNRLIDKEQNAIELCDVIENIDLMKKSILARAFRGELGTNKPEEESTLELLKEVLRERVEK